MCSDRPLILGTWHKNEASNKLYRKYFAKERPTEERANSLEVLTFDQAGGSFFALGVAGGYKQL